MQKIVLLISLAILTLTLKSQNTLQEANIQRHSDSLKSIAKEHAALLYPRIRQFSITHEENGFGHIHSKSDGDELFEGNFRSASTKINMNIPVWERRNSSFIASLGAIHQFYELRDVRNFGLEGRVNDNKIYMPMFSTGLSYMRSQPVFGKPVTLVASARGIFNPSLSRSQFTFTGLATYPFIQKKNTRLSAGLVLVLDPASPVPAFLMVSYFRKFQKSDIDLMLDLPYRLALRKQMNSKISMTFFNEMFGSNSFFDFSNPLPQAATEKLTLSSMEIKSGLMAEYRISKNAVISLSGGMNYMVNTRIGKSNSRPDDYFLKNKHQPVPYAQVGFSLLPFWKGLNL